MRRVKRPPTASHGAGVAQGDLYIAVAAHQLFPGCPALMCRPLICQALDHHGDAALTHEPIKLRWRAPQRGAVNPDDHLRVRASA